MKYEIIPVTIDEAKIIKGNTLNFGSDDKSAL